MKSCNYPQGIICKGCQHCGLGKSPAASAGYVETMPRRIGMTPDDYKELSDATYLALLDCKIAKMDYKSALAVKGRFLDGHPYPIPFTERELKSKKMLAESRLRHCEFLFRALWKARRRAQQKAT